MDPLQREEIKQAIKDMQENQDLYIEQCNTSAALLKNYYDALIDKGFNSYQALQIVINHGINPGGLNNE